MSTFKLSDQQQAVIDWVRDGKGSLNLVARAGCGKTFTLVQVVQYIVDNGLGEVFLGAYNKSIAGEIQETLKKLQIDWRKAQASTLHSAGFSAWRKIAPGVKVNEKKVFDLIEVISQGNTRDAEVARENGPSIQQAVSLAKQRAFGVLCGVEDQRAWYDLFDHFGLNDFADGYTVDDIIPLCIRVYRMSVAQDRDVIDFDDMILAPVIHNARMWPKDWVFIDEAQDTNPARRALALRMLKPRTGRFIAVGDDRQAIYGFTGADSDSLELIRRELGAQVLPLNLTYRCPKAVVREAQAYVPDIEAHESAPEGTVLHTPLEEWLGSIKGDRTGQAMLCRNTKPLVETAYTLIRKRVPCFVEGREIGKGLIKLSQRWKIKTIDALIGRLDTYLERETGKWLAKGKEDRAAAVEDKVGTLRVIVDQCLEAGKKDVVDVVEFIERLFGDSDQGSRGLCLSTIHKSKGREWDTVYILGANFYQPSKWARKDWQLHQEDNLSYVAITRAQDTLVFVDV